MQLDMTRKMIFALAPNVEEKKILEMKSTPTEKKMLLSMIDEL